MGYIYTGGTLRPIGIKQESTFKTNPIATFDGSSKCNKIAVDAAGGSAVEVVSELTTVKSANGGFFADSTDIAKGNKYFRTTLKGQLRKGYMGYIIGTFFQKRSYVSTNNQFSYGKVGECQPLTSAIYMHNECNSTISGEIMTGCIPEKLTLAVSAGTFDASFISAVKTASTTETDFPREANDFNNPTLADCSTKKSATVTFGGSAVKAQDITLTLENSVVLDESFFGNSALATAKITGAKISGSFVSPWELGTATNTMWTNSGSKQTGSLVITTADLEITLYVSLTTVTVERGEGWWQTTGNFEVVVDPATDPTDDIQATTTKIRDLATSGDITSLF